VTSFATVSPARNIVVTTLLVSVSMEMLLGRSFLQGSRQSRWSPPADRGAKMDTTKVFNSQVSIAHTRWATHGPPSVVNCHPLRSDPTSDFIVVHNGIVTNAAALRLVLQNRGLKFESETDTEAVAILTKYVYDSQPDKRITFTELVKAVLKELEGSFAFVFKSKHYPDEVVTARRGSPLLIGVKTDKKLKVDFVDVEFAGQESDQKIVETRELLCL
jgi:glucosamine--fructose-6-phosphate aminotransferase (isomerizing)